MKSAASEDRKLTWSGRGQLRLYVITILAVALLLGVAAFLGSQRQHGAQDYLVRLKASGEKLTYEELSGADPSIANPVPGVVAKTADALQTVKFSPGNLDLWAYAGPGRIRVAWEQSGAPDRQGKLLPWEELSNCLEQAEQPLKALRELLKTAPPEWGRRTNAFQNPTGKFVAIRLCAQWLSAAALHDLHAKRLEEALEDIEALGALGRANTLDYTLVSEMIRIAVANLGLTVTWHALQAEGWSDSQLKRLQQTWQAMDMLEAAEHGLLGERAGGVGVWDQARRSGGGQIRQMFAGSPQTRLTWETALHDYAFWPAYKITSMDADELFYLQAMQDAITGVRDLRLRKCWDPGRCTATLTNKLNQISSSPVRLRYYISLMALPNYTRALQTAVRGETQLQLTLAALALKRYELRYHMPPPDLGALVPDLLKEEPYDPMSGRALRYQLRPNGDYVLYSIGEDGEDHGGEPNPPVGGKAGLWEGRDAVWPRPVR